MTAGWIAALFVAALIPGYIAARKRPATRNRTFAEFYVFGVILWIAAVPFAIWGVKDERKTQCRHCLEDVKVGAVVCPHCQRDISGDVQEPISAAG